MKFFITGHGGWKPKNGYFQTPKNGTVKFFTQNAKLMLNTDVYKLVSGELNVEPSQEVGPFRWCPNMTLSPDDDHEKPITDSSWRGGSETKSSCVIRVKKKVRFADLAEYLLNRYPSKLSGGRYEFWWCCCRQLELRATKDTTYDPVSKRFVPGDGGIGVSPEDEDDEIETNENYVDTDRIGVNISQWVGPRKDGKIYAEIIMLGSGGQLVVDKSEQDLTSGRNQEFMSDRNHGFGKVVLNRKK